MKSKMTIRHDQELKAAARRLDAASVAFKAAFEALKDSITSQAMGAYSDASLEHSSANWSYC